MNNHQQLTTLLNQFFQEKHASILTPNGAYVRGVQDIDFTYMSQVESFAARGIKIPWTAQWGILETMLWSKEHRILLDKVMSGPKFNGM
jgi:hypothetical protein